MNLKLVIVALTAVLTVANVVVTTIAWRTYRHAKQLVEDAELRLYAEALERGFPMPGKP